MHEERYTVVRTSLWSTRRHYKMYGLTKTAKEQVLTDWVSGLIFDKIQLNGSNIKY